MGQDGFHLGEAGTGVLFDLKGISELVHIQWVENDGNEAFLVQDLNGNGRVDNGSELFGNGTRLELQDNILAPDGYVGLAQYDSISLGGNDDGFISSEDEVWQRLGFWLDADANGYSTEEEMLNVEDTGITHFTISPKHNNRTDSAGNSMPLWSWAFDDDKQQGNRKFKMVDVFFKRLD